MTQEDTAKLVATYAFLIIFGTLIICFVVEFGVPMFGDDNYENGI